jgi:hypothetical protein
LPLVSSTMQQLCALQHLFLFIIHSLCSLQGCVESQLLRRTHFFIVGSFPVSFIANHDIYVHDWSFFCAALNSAIN